VRQVSGPASEIDILAGDEVAQREQQRFLIPYCSSHSSSLNLTREEELLFRRRVQVQFQPGCNTFRVVLEDLIPHPITERLRRGNQ
jgi:hypothetical protein